MTTQTETFLVKDMAYDSGIQHQSRIDIYTANGYMTIHMVKATGATDTDYFYLYDYSSRELTQLNKKT